MNEQVVAFVLNKRVECSLVGFTMSFIMFVWRNVVVVALYHCLTQQSFLLLLQPNSRRDRELELYYYLFMQRKFDFSNMALFSVFCSDVFLLCPSFRVVVEWNVKTFMWISSLFFCPCVCVVCWFCMLVFDSVLQCAFVSSIWVTL